LKEYLIDGNNVIGKSVELKKFQLKDKQLSRVKVANMTEAFFLRKSAHKAVLFFDGFENDKIALQKVKIKYSNAKTADSLIKYEIEYAKNPKNLIVVSSDYEISSFARVCSCTVLSSEEFLNMISDSSLSKDSENERLAALEKEKERFIEMFCGNNKSNVK